MPDITFIAADGTETGFEAPDGVSLMAAATGFGVPGILADCGGSASCGTCHVIVDPAWADRLPAPETIERMVLETTRRTGRPHQPAGLPDPPDAGAAGPAGAPARAAGVNPADRQSCP
jgi:2Fe-2S ferredoxin